MVMGDARRMRGHPGEGSKNKQTQPSRSVECDALYNRGPGDGSFFFLASRIVNLLFIFATDKINTHMYIALKLGKQGYGRFESSGNCKNPASSAAKKSKTQIRPTST